MFQHFVGRVFIFHPPPQEDLPFVDIPIYTQDEGTPASLLIQLAAGDLSERSKARISDFVQQDVLPVEVLRRNSGVDPQAQIDLAEHLLGYSRAAATIAFWKSMPDWKQLTWACEMIWRFLTTGRGRSGVFSAKQLAFKVRTLMRSQTVRQRIEAELQPGQYAAESADDAVERVFEFDRNWAAFELPRLMMALSRIQEAIFLPRFGTAGNYSYFATRVETLFKNPLTAALEEYGLPGQVTEKIQIQRKLDPDIDRALETIRALDAGTLHLTPFEAELFQDVQSQV
jgi:hypothetical protein